MATATFIGLLAITKAINPGIEDLSSWVFAWVLLYDLTIAVSKLRSD